MYLKLYSAPPGGTIRDFKSGRTKGWQSMSSARLQPVKRKRIWHPVKETKRYRLMLDMKSNRVKNQSICRPFTGYREKRSCKD